MLVEFENNRGLKVHVIASNVTFFQAVNEDANAMTAIHFVGGGSVQVKDKVEDVATLIRNALRRTV